MTEKEASELKRHISGLIKEKGPITFVDFMELALYHPTLGYYTTGKDVWGETGDYITNADAGPVFQKLIARQIEEAWRALSCPEDFILIEAGGGRGTLLKGILASLKEDSPGLYGVLSPVMIERGEKSALASLDGKPINWYNELKEAGPVRDGVIFSNELLDALPFHRVVGSQGGLKEIFVGLDYDGSFVDTVGEPSTGALSDYFSSLGIDLPEGQVAEVSLEAAEWIKEAGTLLKRGFVISIDYGLPARELYSPEKRGTLLCHYRHTINEDPYSLIGLQDITAHVDFSSVLRAGSEADLKLTGFSTQLHYLLGLGIAEELKEAEGTSEECLQAIAHNQSIKRLIMPGGMGETFKVLVQHKGVDTPAFKGFSFKDMSNLL